MFCPVCRAEYRQGNFRCADCDVTLVHQLDDAPPQFSSVSPEEFAAPEPEARGFRAVALWRGNDSVAYTALVQALHEAHIPNFNRFVAGQQLEPPLQHLFDIYVLERDLEEAQEVAREVLAAAASEARNPADYLVPDELLAEGGEPDAGEPGVEDIGNDDSFPVVWTGVNQWLAESLHAALFEQAIPSRQLNDTAGVMHIFVRAADLVRAGEIVRRTVEGLPPR
jgi:hypothetical protein